MTAEAWTRLAIIIGAVLLLEVLCRLAIIDPLTVIPPSAMAAALGRLLASGEITPQIARTFSNVVIAFMLSIAVGFSAGVVIHALPRLRRALDPFLASWYSIPVYVFYPLLIAIFGITIWPLILIAFAAAVAAMVIATLNALDRVPRVLRKFAKVQQMGRAEEAFRIVLPAAAPYLFTGLKLSLTYSFTGVLAGEFILSNAGLGFAIAQAYESFENETMYALMLFILLLAAIINLSLHAWEANLIRRRSRQ